MKYVPAVASLTLIVPPAAIGPLRNPVASVLPPEAVVSSMGLDGKLLVLRTLRVWTVFDERFFNVTVVPGGNPMT